MPQSFAIKADTAVREISCRIACRLGRTTERRHRLMRSRSTAAGYNPAEERATRVAVAKILIVDDEPNIREVVGL
jgi:DNA-binding response OmpR family regulator